MDVTGPIIPGFAPDPSICLIGDTFYLVNSSFHLFPGLPIYASQDLVSWKHVGNAINRTSQISLRHSDTSIVSVEGEELLLATGGLYAPTIRHRNGVSYIVCTNVVRKKPDGEGTCNFIIHTTDIEAGVWSDPVYFAFDGIDPSIFFDDDDQAYIQVSQASKSEIYNFKIDLHTGELLSEPKLIWSGWDKRWTEGPHIYKKDGWYYLVCAEGGTFESHMVNICRSSNIWGPYSGYDWNPLWTAHGTVNYIQHTGHADLFQDGLGKWWLVMLGVRRKNDRYPMGRETFLASVDWPEQGWPWVKGGLSNEVSKHEVFVPSVTMENVSWVFVRDPDLGRFRFDDSSITIKATNCDLGDPNVSPCFLGQRQRRLKGSCKVQISSIDKFLDHKVRAALALYKDEHRFIMIGVDFSKRLVYLEGVNKATSFSIYNEYPLGNVQAVSLRIDYDEEAYKFSFKMPGESNETLLGTVDTLVMTAHDFVGPILGMYCTAAEGSFDVNFQDFTID